jgi:hypothetical protein
MIALDFLRQMSYNVRAFSDARFSIEGRRFPVDGNSPLSISSKQPNSQFRRSRNRVCRHRKTHSSRTGPAS